MRIKERGRDLLWFNQTTCIKLDSFETCRFTRPVFRLGESLFLVDVQ